MSAGSAGVLLGPGTRLWQFGALQGMRDVQIRAQLLGVLREVGQDGLYIPSAAFHLAEAALQYFSERFVQSEKRPFPFRGVNSFMAGGGGK